MTNLAWASGQAIAAAGSGVLAQSTSDVVPYTLLAAACLVTLVVLWLNRTRWILRRVPRTGRNDAARLTGPIMAFTCHEQKPA